jgi:hypothetical protein
MRRPDLLRAPDPLVGAARRHPDVGEDGIRSVFVDGGEQFVEARRRADDLDLVGGREEGRGTFPHEVVILGEDHPQRHARMVHARKLGVAA